MQITSSPLNVQPHVVWGQDDPSCARWQLSVQVSPACHSITKAHCPSVTSGVRLWVCEEPVSAPSLSRGGQHPLVGFFLSLLPRLLAGLFHRGQLRIFKSSHRAGQEPTIWMSKELPCVKGCRSWVQDEKLQGTWGKGTWSRAGWVPPAKYRSQKRQQHVIVH